MACIGLRLCVFVFDFGGHRPPMWRNVSYRYAALSSYARGTDDSAYGAICLRACSGLIWD
eukprot:685142-Rhodomonas_salina.4